MVHTLTNGCRTTASLDECFFLDVARSWRADCRTSLHAGARRTRARLARREGIDRRLGEKRPAVLVCDWTVALERGNGELSLLAFNIVGFSIVVLLCSLSVCDEQWDATASDRTARARAEYCRAAR
ncbi:hypothetical protein [Paraburkholderia fynbosensis]|uniref:hypothetical protein n=1 Tax=Paraburkholderia fynbosensis TaxID=1200993 RepID=UPI001583FCF8|nr:hypothetical protein [Paraburkholderia fynbosensis]